MLTIGVDVGVTGAIATIDESSQIVALDDLPVMSQGKCKWIDSASLLELIRRVRDGRNARVCVEFIHAVPKMGCTTGHSMGLTLGSVLATVQMAGLPLELVPPQMWKRALGLQFASGTADGTKKAASLAKARLLFPAADLDRVKDHNRAEALLIAHYAQRYLQASRNAA